MVNDSITPLDQIVLHLRTLTNFAYENGYHELGYDPVDEILKYVVRWESIGLAPKDGTILLVDDNTKKITSNRYVTAYYTSSPEHAGWVYADEDMDDDFPEGPNPTRYLEIPTICQN